jgi:hypothetical protein
VIISGEFPAIDDMVSLARRKTAGRMDGAKHYLVLLGSAALKEVSDERRH